MSGEELQKLVISCPECKSTNIKHFGNAGNNLYCRTCEYEGESGDGTVESAIKKWNQKAAQHST